MPADYTPDLGTDEKGVAVTLPEGADRTQIFRAELLSMFVKYWRESGTWKNAAEAGARGLCSVTVGERTLRLNSAGIGGSSTKKLIVALKGRSTSVNPEFTVFAGSYKVFTPVSAPAVSGGGGGTGVVGRA